MDSFFFHLHPFLLKTWAILLGQMLVIETHPESLHSKRNYRNLKYSSYSSKSVTLSWGCHFISTRVLYTFSQWLIPLSSGKLSNGKWGLYGFEIGTPALLWEQMSLWAAIDFFCIYNPTQMCYYSGLSSLLSICVGTQGQEIISLSLFLLVFSHCFSLSQSVWIVWPSCLQLHCHFQIW